MKCKLFHRLSIYHKLFDQFEWYFVEVNFRTLLFIIINALHCFAADQIQFEWVSWNTNLI